MFSDDKSMDSLQHLFKELKKYFELQKEYTKLEIVEKLTILLSTLIMIAIFILLGAITLFYLFLCFAYILQPLVGGLTASYAIISGCFLLLIIIVVVFRKKLIVNPMVSFLANLFLNESDE